jgi:hypothetical protein
VILYERAGQGHLAAAEILRSILEADPEVEVVLLDGDRLASDKPGENAFVSLWNPMIRRGWFRLADLIFNYWLRLAIYPVLVVTSGARAKARLKALRPDAILTTADIFSRVLGDGANELGVPLTVMPTEFSVYADILHPDAHHLCYFEATARAIRRFDLSTPHFREPIVDHASFGERLRFVARWFRAYGLRRLEPLLFQSAGDPAPATNDLTCLVMGPLRDPRHHAPVGARPAGERHEIVVLSGSLGGRFVSSVVRQLIAAPDFQGDVVAVCGRDGATRATLQALPLKDGIRLECLGYVDDLPARLRRASLLVARPSAGVFLEAMLAGLPQLLSSRATKNDAGTIELMREWGIGETFDHVAEIPAVVAGMLPRLPEYRAQLADLRTRVVRPWEETAARIRAVAWRSVR